MHTNSSDHYVSSVNVKDFGALGNGTTDDTEAIQSTFESLKQGGIVAFPVGKYVVKRRILVNYDHVTIRGEGTHTHIVYNYEQKEAEDDLLTSLFVFREGIRNVTISDMKLEYTGCFFPEFGQSYSGKVSALRFWQCFDVLVKNMEICGFNANAVTVATGDSTKYAQRLKVTQCYLHHNRVAGVHFGYVDGVSIIDNDLTYHGSVLDGGTGYGCCGSSHELPRNVQMIGNRANYNYRKGLDLHAGIGAVIADNICHGNRLYGIYAEGSKTGNVIIKGNIVSGMHYKRLDISEPYTWIMGIDFGPFSESLVPEEYHNYIIEGNQILDFGLEHGDAYPINCYYNMATGMVQIRNNMIAASKITHLIRMNSKVKQQGERKVQVDISHNQAIIERCTDSICYLPYCDQLNISYNQINLKQVNRSQSFLFLPPDNLQMISNINNQINFGYAIG